MDRPDDPLQVQVVQVVLVDEERAEPTELQDRVAFPIRAVEGVADPDPGQGDQHRHGREAERERLGFGPGEAHPLVESARVGQADPPGRHREEREQDHGIGHRARRFVRMRVPAIRAEEGEQHRPRHVQGREERGGKPDDPDRVVVRVIRGREDRVLREEPGERRDAREGDRPDREHPERHRKVLPEPSHLAHVVRVHRMDHRPGGEEQQGLEERVGEQMEEAGGVALRAEPERRHHVGELRDRRVGEHAFDVVLDEREERRDQHGDRADRSHERERMAGGGEHGEHPAHHVDAGRDHRRRVDERGHRRGARHRVGEPHVQRELSRLPDRAAEEQERRRGQRPCGEAPVHRLRGDRRHVRRPGGEGQHEDSEQERDVAGLRGDERLDRRARVLLLLPPVPDQQVGTDAHQLPADQELEEVVGDHQVQHRRGEDGERCEVPRVAGVSMHVRGRIDLDAQRYQCDHDEHHRGQTVDVLPDLHVERAGGEEGNRPVDDGVSGRDLAEHDHRQHEADADRDDPDRGASSRSALSEEHDQEEGRGGQRRNQPGEGHHPAVPLDPPPPVTTSAGSLRPR